jgi:CheY-like chemotaxis protein
MPSGGSLRVGAVAAADEQGARRLRITVEDTGVGIAAKDLPRIFEPFFTTKPKGVGTGLGLAVVARAVDAAHGKVSVQSDPGHGTRFVLEFPAFESTRIASSDTMLPAAKLRILLAEDHAMLRSMLGEVLRAQGHEVVECAGGADALRLSTDLVERFDVHVLDLVLPAFGGEFVHRRGEEVHGRRIPAVFISGEPQPTAEGTSETHIRLLAKPFDIAEFARAVQDVAASVASE